MISLAMTMQAGAEMNEAETRWPAIVGISLWSIRTYMASTVEAMVPMPAVMMVPSSERVMSLRWGRTTRADSTPTKMLAETERASAPLILIVREKIQANSRTKNGMMPR